MFKKILKLFSREVAPSCTNKEQIHACRHSHLQTHYKEESISHGARTNWTEFSCRECDKYFKKESEITLDWMRRTGRLHECLDTKKEGR